MAEMAQVLARVEGFPAPRGPLDLEVRRGDVLLVRGRNGAGKTSLLRALAGLPAPLAARRVEVAGRDPRDTPAPLLQAALATQDPRDGLVGLTVAGEFRLRGAAVPPEAAPWRDRPLAAMSSGEARRVALAACAARNQPLWLLDEPEEGLDAAAQGRLRDLMRRQAERGAVVVADHAGTLAQAATRILDLDAPESESPWRIPAPGGPVRLESEAAQVERGGTAIRLPALRLGPGLHGLAGRNGSGKSTLLLRLAGLLGAPAARVDGRPAVMGRGIRLLLPRARELFSRERVGDELAGVGLEDPLWGAAVPQAWRARHPARLSGGQAQRVALAKCLGVPAPLYLLDEPEAHLDGPGRAWLGEALARRAGEGSCIVAASHDPDVLAACRSVALLEGP